MKGNRDSIYLVLEGPGKGGKDTIGKSLAGEFLKKGFRVIETYEPGGTPEGEVIRKKLFEEKREKLLSPEDELTLVYEARKYTMEKVVMPALALPDKTVVISSRNFLSSFVYQEASGVPRQKILDFHRKNYLDMGYPMPDLTLLMLVDHKVAARRLGYIGSDGDAFDELGMEFLKQISIGYGEMAYQSMRGRGQLLGRLEVMVIQNNLMPEEHLTAEAVCGIQGYAWRKVEEYFGLDEEAEGNEPGLEYHRISPLERSRMRR